MSKIGNELRYYLALKRIAAYMSSDALRRKSEKMYGISGEEAIEMAYDNVLNEARSAVKGKRMPVDDPSAQQTRFHHTDTPRRNGK